MHWLLTLLGWSHLFNSVINNFNDKDYCERCFESGNLICRKCKYIENKNEYKR